MRKIFSFSALVALPLVIVACGTSNPAITVADTCNTAAASISTLADFRAQGNLSAAQVANVSGAIAVIDPICSAPTPPTTLSGASAAAAKSLAALLVQLGGAK